MLKANLNCFKGYMQDFQSEAEDYHLGGKVSALAKYSKEIQHINVAEQVNNGVNLITFFGHSSATRPTSISVMFQIPY